MELTQNSLQLCELHIYHLSTRCRLQWHKPHATVMNEVKLIRTDNDKAKSTVWAF